MIELKDSGNRRAFESGAVRDMAEGKGCCDLMPLDVVGEIAGIIYENTMLYNVLRKIDAYQSTGEDAHLMAALEYAYLWEDAATMFLEVAKHFEAGCLKYGENNWKKGIPTKCYIDSAVRHLLKYIRGDRDEPHDRAFARNIICCIWTCKHLPELNSYKENVK